MTNTKLFDFLQKYLAEPIYIIASTVHTVGTYLVNRFFRKMRRQEDPHNLPFSNTLSEAERKVHLNPNM